MRWRSVAWVNANGGEARYELASNVCGTLRGGPWPARILIRQRDGSEAPCFPGQWVVKGHATFRPVSGSLPFYELTREVREFTVAVPMTAADPSGVRERLIEARRLLRKLRWKIEKWRPTGHKLRRRFVERCESCGHHARWTESWHAHGNEDGKVWHGPCIALESWRNTAEERLIVLDVITEVWAVTSRDVQTLASLREDEWDGRGRFEDLVWRAFYALKQRHKAAASDGAR